MANTLSVLRLTDVIWRLLLAVALGGTIGLEREFKRRPTGLRTHMLMGCSNYWNGCGSRFLSCGSCYDGVDYVY